MPAFAPKWAEQPPEVPIVEDMRSAQQEKARKDLLKSALLLLGFGLVCFCLVRLLLLYIPSQKYLKF
jgi:hypothetical protein